MQNKIGPNTEPCGTPLSISAQSDVIPLTQTLWRLFFNHSVTQPRSLPSIPCAFNFRISNPCRTLLKALYIPTLTLTLLALTLTLTLSLMLTVVTITIHQGPKKPGANPTIHPWDGKYHLRVGKRKFAKTATSASVF